MKKLLLLSMFFSAALSSFSLTMTHSLDFGGTQNILLGENLAYGNMMVDVGYRFSVCPEDLGFYTGADVTFGVPTLTIWSPDTGVLEGRTFHISWDPPENFFSDIKIPFGYRWEDSFIKGMGFYLGGGPSSQFIVTDNGLTSAFGLFGELGFQTDKTSGVGFHLGIQWGTYPLVYINDWKQLTDGWGFETTLKMGMSWRRQK
jgi:hypothetical protein